MFFSVDSGTVDAPSYPAIAVWANPAKTGNAGQKWYLAGLAFGRCRDRAKTETACASWFFPGYSSSFICGFSRSTASSSEL
jgi:hypothetical protein